VEQTEPEKDLLQATFRITINLPETKFKLREVNGTLVSQQLSKMFFEDKITSIHPAMGKTMKKKIIIWFVIGIVCWDCSSK